MSAPARPRACNRPCVRWARRLGPPPWGRPYRSRLPATRPVPWDVSGCRTCTRDIERHHRAVLRRDGAAGRACGAGDLAAIRDSRQIVCRCDRDGRHHRRVLRARGAGDLAADPAGVGHRRAAGAGREESRRRRACGADFSIPAGCRRCPTPARCSWVVCRVVPRCDAAQASVREPESQRHAHRWA
jgi:hypothetical protein